MSKSYVIYYGWLCDDDSGTPNDRAVRIRDAEVPLLIAHFWTAEPERHRNLSAQLLSELHARGTQVFSYVRTDQGNADVHEIRELVNQSIDGGVDGIFFDEVPSSLSGDTLRLYRGLSDLVRSKNKAIIMNPGVSRCEASLMDLTDFLMLEHEWRDFRNDSPWAAAHPDERFMGVSSNEGNAMGYEVTEAQAIEDTHEAWQERHIGWHTSTDMYIALPDWFEAWVEAV